MTPTRANGKVNSQNRKIKALAKKIEFLSEKMKELKAKRRKEKEEAVKRKLRNKRIRAEAERKISQHKKDLWSKEMRIKELEKQNSRAKAISKATIKELKKKNEYRKKEIERLKIQIRSAVCQVCLEPFVEKPTPHVLYCGHAVCEDCLKTMCNGVSVIRCPTCRKHWKLSPTVPFPKNYALLRTIGQ